MREVEPSMPRISAYHGICVPISLRAAVLVVLFAVAAPYPKTAQAETDKNFWVTNVLLPAPERLDAARLGSALQARLDRFDRHQGLEVKGEGIVVRVAGGVALILAKDEPMPANVLEDPCSFPVWHSMKDCPTARTHRAHFLIALHGTDLDQLDAAVLQTKIVAAVTEVSAAETIYWDGTLVPRDYFLKHSKKVERLNPPVTLWISFRISREPNGHFSMSTVGLQHFDLMEMEAKDAPIAGDFLAGMFFYFAGYLITNGPVIEDGDTIGPSPDDKIYMFHRESWWNAGQKVYRIEFGK